MELGLAEKTLIIEINPKVEKCKKINSLFKTPKD